MSKKITFKYAIGEEVTVLGLSLKGIVVAFLVDVGCVIQYKVVYWADSVRVETWLYDFEIGVK